MRKCVACKHFKFDPERHYVTEEDGWGECTLTGEQVNFWSGCEKWKNIGGGLTKK
jgi:hypothetical protein